MQVLNSQCSNNFLFSINLQTTKTVHLRPTWDYMAAVPNLFLNTAYMSLLPLSFNLSLTVGAIIFAAQH
jgi:hypothetical protein